MNSQRPVAKELSTPYIRARICNTSSDYLNAGRTVACATVDRRRNVEIGLDQLVDVPSCMACECTFLASHSRVQRCAIASGRLLIERLHKGPYCRMTTEC